MRWEGRRESDNVIDQRRFGAGKMSIGTLIIGAIVYYFMGGNPIDYVAQNAASTQQRAPASVPADDPGKRFSAVVLADTEDVWGAEFQRESMTYQPPQLVLFRDLVESGCGRASVSSGPFYCPADHRVYLDLSFFEELSKRLGAKGDFAAAYVIAHEVGHHIQNLIGVERSARQAQAGASEVERNRISVQVELQADCLAGVWAKQTEQTKNVLEQGDIEEALGAASAIGDDRLQMMTRGQAVPDSFTHGTSQQRQSAFQKGYLGGRLRSCVQR